MSSLHEKLKAEEAKSEGLLDKMRTECSTHDRLQLLEAKSNDILAQLHEASSGLDLKEEAYAGITSR